MRIRRRLRARYSTQAHLATGDRARYSTQAHPATVTRASTLRRRIRLGSPASGALRVRGHRRPEFFRVVAPEEPLVVRVQCSPFVHLWGLGPVRFATAMETVVPARCRG
ncbi:hypothetical protein chiPu_0018130 [Chiloscyllium punctatum]|uniref:Uncharacterized protein n=1 Tax=Chiloscyllium punctatum TaxID=137246 RepID=A0A401RLE1_CHIPU|nr:hypothetical protein [Chiloscyllium punctatum]